MNENFSLGDSLPRTLLRAVATCVPAAALFINGGCASAPPDETLSTLQVSPAEYDFSENPALLERVQASPHGYFRFVNIPFSNVVCRRYPKLVEGAPRLNLHGDAHIEQYAVTDLGRGLTDYDDSSTGPGALDLLRFGVSLKLTCLANGWEDRSEELLDRFLAGYLEALRKPAAEAPEPALVRRFRSSFKSDRENYFNWVQSIMEPVPEEEAAELTQAMKPYVQNMLQELPDYQPEYFQAEKIGYLRLGIGSALDRKYLVRVRGPSADPGDDVVLEIKEVRNLEQIECVQAAPNDPFRVLLSQARIAYTPFNYLGYADFKGSSFWIHAWVDNYKEADVEESFQTPQELLEVAFDVGTQLGLGHPKQIAAPFDVQVRRSQRRLVEANLGVLKKACNDLTREVVDSWRSFRDALGRPPGQH